VTDPEAPRDFAGVLIPLHAGEKMDERRVDNAQITRTIYNPHRLYPGNKPGRMVAERDDERGRFMVRVVYVVEAEEKVRPGAAYKARRMSKEQGVEYIPRKTAVVVTVIRIKKRRTRTR
jgi:hypothetical protein